MSFRELTQPMPAHPAAQLFPPMTDAEYEQLCDDMQANGQVEPVVILGEKILDGRHRLRACLQLGVPCQAVDANEFAKTDPESFVLAKNLHRRHLTAAMRRAIIKHCIKANPEKSNRKIAAETKVNHRTVATCRNEMETGGEILHLNKRHGADGKNYAIKRDPFKKQPKPKKQPRNYFFHFTRDAKTVAAELARRFGKNFSAELVGELQKHIG